MGIVVLTGPKHAGKTSAGAALAGLLNVPFVDLDESVTARTGKSPRALYREGPEVFRAAEAGALGDLVARTGKTRMVIAAGGGIADNEAAITLLADTADVHLVYIQVSAETAWERISRAAAQTGELPPFLNTEAPRQTHEALHRRRATVYRELAGFIVDGEGRTPEDIAREIAGNLNTDGGI